MDIINLLNINKKINMSEINTLIDIENKQSTISKILDNKIVSTLFVMFIAFYGGLIGPKIPPMFIELFNTKLFKISILILIGIILTKNYNTAIICAMSFYIGLHLLDNK